MENIVKARVRVIRVVGRIIYFDQPAPSRFEWQVTRNPQEFNVEVPEGTESQFVKGQEWIVTFEKAEIRS